MNQIDTTIVNVALPHMQGSNSASREEITWVLTSYIVAAAIFMPLTGWLAGRFGRRQVMLVSIFGFTVASALCGMASELEQIVGFRILQGVFGSALLPLAQSTLLDLYPRSEHGKAMGLFGLAAIVGPLVGPLLGGYLTDTLSWRWVFYINLPIGVAAFLGLSTFLPKAEKTQPVELDILGYVALAIGLGALQLMLDRGITLDWFDSTEIWITTCCAIASFAVFIVHSLTHPRPFISAALYRDRNFLISTFIGFFLGGLVYSVLSLLPPLLGDLLGHTSFQIGEAMAPRGIATLLAMPIVGRLTSRFDARLLVFTGLMLCGLSMLQMSWLSLEADDFLIECAGFVQGIGNSLIFVPLATMGFATLPGEYRDEAAALNTLVRNMGSAIGISVVQAMTVRNFAGAHTRLAESIWPENFERIVPQSQWDLGEQTLLSRFNSIVNDQAMMIAYVDVFWTLFIVCIVISPSVLLLKIRKAPPAKS